MWKRTSHGFARKVSFTASRNVSSLQLLLLAAAVAVAAAAAAVVVVLLFLNPIGRQTNRLRPLKTAQGAIILHTFGVQVVVAMAVVAVIVVAGVVDDEEEA